MLGFAVLGAAPGLLVMFLVDFLDRKRPEPRWALRRVALAGGIAILPAILIELGLMKLYKAGGVTGSLYQAFVVAALVEETLKALCVRWFVWNRPELDERTDGIVYGTRAGLGFAIVENVAYLLGARNPIAFIGMFVFRSALAVPMHAIAGALTGHFAALRRFDGRGPGMLGGLGLAILLHGTYDAALFLIAEFAKEKHGLLSLVLLPVPLLCVGLGALAVRRMWRSAEAADMSGSAAARRLA
jgi:RsiW-degrading membrane proteinase PrsW (M82 family)